MTITNDERRFDWPLIAGLCAAIGGFGSACATETSRDSAHSSEAIRVLGPAAAGAGVPSWVPGPPDGVPPVAPPDGVPPVNPPPDGSESVPPDLDCAIGPIGEIRVDFDCASVTIDTCRELSNVVVEYEDGTQERFEGLSGQRGTFTGAGANGGKRIIRVWVKAGGNLSGDGPGFGTRFDAGEGSCDDDPCTDNDPDTICDEGEVPPPPDEPPGCNGDPGCTVD